MNEEEKRIDELRASIDEIEEEIGIEMFVNVVEEEGVKKREISEKIRRCEELRRKYVEKTTELERRSHGKSPTFKKVEEDITREIERMKNMRTKVQNEKIDGEKKVGAKVKAADAKKQVHVKEKAREVKNAEASAKYDEENDKIAKQKAREVKNAEASAKKDDKIAKQKAREVKNAEASAKKDDKIMKQEAREVKNAAASAEKDDEENDKIIKQKARVVNDAATSANRDENGKTAERSEKINIKRKARAKDKAAERNKKINIENEKEAAAAIAQKDDEEVKDCKACKDEDEAKNGNNDENEAKAGRNDKDKNAKKGEDDEEEGKTAKVARNEDEPSEDEESTVYKLMKEYESDSEDKTTEDKLNKRYPEENDEDYVPSEEESKESIEYNSDAEISQDVEASQDAGDSQEEVERQEAVESPECAEVKDCEEAYEERRRNSTASVEPITVDQLMKDSDDDVSQEDPNYVPEESGEDSCEYNSDEEVIKDDADDQELVEVVEEATQDSNAPSEEVSQDDPQEDPPEVEEVVVSQEDSQEVEKTIKVEKDKFCFKGNGGVDKKDYGVELKLLKEIDPEKYKYAMQPRAIDFALEKKDAIPYWNRLLETEVEQHWLKVDFSKWKEKDDNYDESSGALPTKYVQINTGDKESGELVTDSVLVMPAVSAQPREGIGVLKDSVITHTLSKLCINGAVIAVSIEKLFNFDKLLEHLTHIVCKQGTLLNIFSPFDGSYVCSKKLNYTSLVIVRDAFRWRGWSGSGLNLDLAVRPRTASAQLAHSSLVGGGVHGRGDQWRKTK